MDAETRQFLSKVVASVAAIAIAVLSFTNPPVLHLDPVLAGALLAGGLGALGINIGGAWQGARAAARARARAAKRAQG